MRLDLLPLHCCKDYKLLKIWATVHTFTCTASLITQVFVKLHITHLRDHSPICSVSQQLLI